MFDYVIAGGRVIDGTGLPAYLADVGIEGGRIASIGRLDKAEAKARLDAAGKVVCPGFIDAHVHGDLRLLEDPLHEPAIRQGVTTYVLGQDGVAMAPGTAATISYMRRYTAGFAGLYELPERGLTIAEYLALFDRRCALNVSCLVPNGNARMDAMGLDTRKPHPDELRHLRRIVREGMEQGAVGLSSGLDYIPSRYADTEELSALCEEIAPFGGVYVTHMRRYDPEGVIGSMDEVFRIGREAGCAVHISHFNSRASIVLPHFDTARRQGIDATYDLYCYLAGSTILGMIALPPETQEGGSDATMKRLQDPNTRSALRLWFEKPRIPLEGVRISFVANPLYRRLEGLTLEKAAKEVGTSIGDLVCDLLVSSNLAVGCVAPHKARDEEDVKALTRHPSMMAGSDGIYTGGFPHPRGCGCFARYLSHYVRDAKVWSLEQAVQHLSAHAARRFGLKDRGFLQEGMAADVVVFDPETIRDESTYDAGRNLAVGVEHVLVNGVPVLQSGQRTSSLPGRALRHGRA